ncbi:hypothetical protein ABEX78_24725 [Priestia megaterium]
MDLKQCAKIRMLAENNQFIDLKYANEIIVSLCNELEEKTILATNLTNEIKMRPITYPHHCYLVINRYSIEEFYLFREKYEAELFRLAHEEPRDYQVKTVELFEEHKKAILTKEYAFLRS